MVVQVRTFKYVVQIRLRKVSVLSCSKKLKYRAGFLGSLDLYYLNILTCTNSIYLIPRGFVAVEGNTGDPRIS